MIFKKILYISIIVIIFMALFSRFALRTEIKTEFAMGTFVDVKLMGFIWDDFDTAFDRAFKAIDEIEKTASLYDINSELSGLNLLAHRQQLEVSGDLFYIIEHANTIYKESQGAFDITIAPLTMLWKPHIKNKSMPNKRAIKNARLLTGSDKLALDGRNNTVYFGKKGMKIDLGSVAKGYAVDRAVCEIKKAGFKTAMVNAGGDVFCLGKKYFILPWRVGIRSPHNKRDIFKYLNISDRAVATSGGYEQFFFYDDKYYSHLIDPKTGYPADNEFLSVTVVADSCFIADAIASAIFIGGTAIQSKMEAVYPEIEVIVIKKDA